MAPHAQILELAIPVRMWQRFDYLPPLDAKDADSWRPGIRIQAPFGRRSVVGVLLAVKSATEVSIEKLKPAIAKLDEQPVLTPSIIALCEWASQYYHHPIGEVFSQALPKALRAGRECPVVSGEPWRYVPFDSSATSFALNTHQKAAIEAITAAQKFQTFLLDGVTGSGKTEVYFHSIHDVLAKGKQALVLVPEISLTPQTLKRFEERFNVPVVLLHSDVSDKKRLIRWLQARNNLAAIIIGTRSAILTPLFNPGIIVLDEEHDLSFKQQNNLRYSARDLAIVRGQLENVPVILGSATPSLESLYNAKHRKYHYLTLPQRAGDAKSPKIGLINLRDKRLTGGLSVPLLEKISEHLAQEGQILLFLNRRGYASVLMCHHCGWMATCARCDARLTLHFQPEKLHCHHCGFTKRPPPQCEKCRHKELITAGQGTERIEQVIAERFPQHLCVRIDRDSVQKRGQIEKLLAQIHEKKAQILIGTQMLAKGHHFPHLSLVAIVDADGGLFSVDFRALERMAQMLVQVAGRAGRAQIMGEVMIQTHHPDHPHLQFLLKGGYSNFANALLIERKQALLPPFGHLALLRAEAADREMVHAFLNAAKADLENTPAVADITLMGPIPAPMERCAGRYRGHLLLQTTRRAALQSALHTWTPGLTRCKMANKVRWSLDIDPQEMM